MNVRDRVPSPAEVARTLVAGAFQARLEIDDLRFPDPVAISTTDDGRVAVILDPVSPMVDVLRECPVATVRIEAPAPYGTLELVGALDRCRESGTTAPVFSLALLKVRFNSVRIVAVPLSAYFDATPDPLREHSVEMVQHLEEGHHEGLLDCLQAHGMTDARAVVPRTIDRYGLDLAVITECGVTNARLAFPGGPVTSVREVAAHLRVVLTCVARRRATEE